ncbi:hypothetical protein [Marinobacter adhaerens]|uniref:hypothetical protein n=1 Tax=Marinobacter adhaerens TaxID=1033846 RepID=UPI003BA99D2E
MSKEKNSKPETGAVNGATIEIQQLPEGLAIAVEFHGDAVDESQREGMKKLALVGVEAMRDWIRERYDVTNEEVLRRPNYQDQKPKTH